MVWTLNIIRNGGDLFEQRHFILSRFTHLFLQVTDGVARTTVHMIAAAYRIWVGTAAVVSSVKQAACVTVWTAALSSGTSYCTRSRIWTFESSFRWDLLEHGERLRRGGHTLLLNKVTPSSLWATVTLVLTADSLSQRTAAPRVVNELAAGGVIGTLGHVGTNDRLFSLLQLCCRKALHPRKGNGLVYTFAMKQITNGPFIATVDMVWTTLSVWQWAAVIASLRVLAASVFLYTHSSIWTHQCGAQAQPCQTQHSHLQHMHV